jgi:hypothetical protein
MSTFPDETPPRVQRVSSRVLAAENSVSIRTIERWTDAGILPQPVRINGRKFWPAGTTPKADDSDGAAA